jgi:hypothetical protein
MFLKILFCALRYLPGPFVSWHLFRLLALKKPDFIHETIYRIDIMGHTFSALLAPGYNYDIALSTDLVDFIAPSSAWLWNNLYAIDGVLFIYVTFYIISLRPFLYR